MAVIKSGSKRMMAVVADKERAGWMIIINILYYQRVLINCYQWTTAEEYTSKKGERIEE